MSKEEYFKKLSEELDILTDEEKEKEIKKYKKSKKFESLGTPEELAKKILDERGIKTETKAKSNNDFEKTANGFFQDLIETVEGVVDYISKKDAKQIIAIILEILIILILIALFKIPFVLIRDLVLGIFDSMGTGYTSGLSQLIRLATEILYFILALFMFITIFKKRFDKYKKKK